MTLAPELADIAAFITPKGDRCIAHGYIVAISHTDGMAAGIAAMTPLTIADLRRDKDAGTRRVCPDCADGRDLVDGFSAIIRDLS